MLKNPKNIIMMVMHSSSAREGTWESRLSKLEVNRSYNENVGCCTVKQADISSLTPDKVRNVSDNNDKNITYVFRFPSFD